MFTEIVIAVVTTASITSFVLYVVWVRPAQVLAQAYYRRSRELAVQLADERTLRTDIVKWIEHECGVYKVPAVERALQQRVNERLELARQLHQRRQELEHSQEV